MSKVLITGSSGGVGKAIAQELIRGGHEVHGFDRLETPDIEHSIVGDILDREVVLDAAADKDVVIHLAAEPDEADFIDKLIEPNVRGLYHVCDAVQRQGVAKLILASTVQVVLGHSLEELVKIEDGPRVTNHYSLTKLWAEDMGEMYARLHDLGVIAVRLGWLPRSKAHAEELGATPWGPDVYLSHNDAARFFRACVDVALEPGRFEIVFASSRAKKPRLDLGPAKRLVGFEPRDIWPEGHPFF